MKRRPRLITYSLLVGARSDRRRFLSADEKILRRITLEHFPEGFTILSADGTWYDSAKARFLQQDARQILICTSERRRLNAWCRALGRALDQKELMVIEIGPTTRHRV